MANKELGVALKLAHKVLDRPHADPDDDMAVLSRQLIRQSEANDNLHSAMADIYTEAGTRDLINTNRDIILDIYQEALNRIKYCHKNGVMDLIPAVISAAQSFHPMHTEGWKWPDGSRDY